MIDQFSEGLDLSKTEIENGKRTLQKFETMKINELKKYGLE